MRVIERTEEQDYACRSGPSGTKRCWKNDTEHRGTPAVPRQVMQQEIPEVQVIERTQEQIEVQIGDIPVPQEQLIAEVTTLNTSSTSTSSASPSQQSSPANTMAAVTTGVKHDNTVLVDSRCSSSLDEFAAPVYNRVRQKLFDAEETTQNTVESPARAPRRPAATVVSMSSRTCSTHALSFSLL